MAKFYAKLMQSLLELGVEVGVNELPMKFLTPCPFQLGPHPRLFMTGDFAQRLWPYFAAVQARAKRISDILHRQMQSGAFLLGKLRLAVTRFSGRRAPSFPAGGGVPNLPEDVVPRAYYS